MNKSDLVEEIAVATGYTRKETMRLVERVFDAMAGALKRGDEVTISGFGIFRRTQRNASTGHNPRTGEKIQIAARRSVKLRPARGLRDALNGPSASTGEPAPVRRSA